MAKADLFRQKVVFSKQCFLQKGDENEKRTEKESETKRVGKERERAQQQLNG